MIIPLLIIIGNLGVVFVAIGILEKTNFKFMYDRKSPTPLEKKMEKQDARIQKLIDRYVNEEISVERLEEETEHVLSGQPGRKYIPPPPRKPSVYECMVCHCPNILEGSICPKCIAVSRSSYPNLGPFPLRNSFGP